MCMSLPMRIPEDVWKELTAYKAFWFKDGGYYPVFRTGIDLSGELGGLPGETLIKILPEDSYHINTVTNKPSPYGSVTCFHAFLPQDLQVSTRIDRLTAAAVAITHYLKDMKWWNIDPQDLNCNAILRAGYLPVVAEVRFTGDLYTDLLTSQVGGTKMCIVNHVVVEL